MAWSPLVPFQSCSKIHGAADTPVVSSVLASGTGITNGNGDLNAGHVVTLTLTMSEAVTVNTTGGTPTLTLNDGGNCDLHRRLRQQRADLQLHGGGRSEHA